MPRRLASLIGLGLPNRHRRKIPVLRVLNLAPRYRADTQRF